MTTLLKSLRILKDATANSGRHLDIPVLILREAAEQLQRAPQISAHLEEEWRRSIPDVFYPHLQACARTLIDDAPKLRLEALDLLLTDGANQKFNFAWMSRGAAKQVAKFAQEASSVRCSFDLALHPALHAAITDGNERTVRFVSKAQEICDLANLSAIMLGVDLDVVPANPLYRFDADVFDVEIIMPPFGAALEGRDALPVSVLERIGASGYGRLHHEAVAIADMLVNAENARAVLGLTSGALFRSVGVEAAVRDELVTSGRLAAVFAVPPGMMYSGTMITTALLVLEPGGKDLETVRFINLSDGHFSAKGNRGRLEARQDVGWNDALEGPSLESCSRDVSIDEIHEQGRILTVDRYLKDQASQALDGFLDKYEIASLADLVDLIRPMSLPKTETGDELIYEAAPKDVDEAGFLRWPQKEVRIDRGAMRKARNQQVLPGDVLLAAKGTIGIVGLVPDGVPDKHAERLWTAGQSFMILRPKGKRILPEVLFEYLSSDAMQKHLHSRAGGTAIQALNARDLKNLSVPVPSMAEQARIREAFNARQDKFSELSRIRQDIQKMKSRSWPHEHLDIDDQWRSGV
jgi:type I restriction enzyme M protein